MSWVDKITYYYENNLWDKEKVKAVVGRVITAEEYYLITGEAYE